MKKCHFFFITAIIFGCANITTPSGGPKDEDPPELISSIPAPKELNFKGKSIELEFNEPVKLNNAKEEILISPSPGKEILYKVKGARVIITPENGWKDSTTYSILFRDGIQDITEGNSPVYLKLAFSTGPTIDSLRISGKVSDLLKGDAVEKITVAVFQQDTFDIFTDTPEYFTKTNKSGRFSLENIRSGIYRIYAFEDKNKNLKVESRTERYGFLSGKYELNKSLDSIPMGLIMLDSRPLKISSVRATGQINRIRFNKHISEYKLSSGQQLVHAFGDNQTEIAVWYPGEVKDSLKVNLTARDSLDFRVDSTFYVKRTEKGFRENFKWSLADPRADSETGKFSTTLTFSKPLTQIVFDSLYIQVDTTSRIAFDRKDFSIDTVRKKIIIQKDLDKKIFKAEKEPELKLSAGRGFLHSIEQDTSAQQTLSVITYWPDRTGILHVQVQTEEKNFIIQLIDSKKKIAASSTNQTKATFKNLNPEEYQIRVIIDSNKNGKWDPGNYRQDQSPEKVVFYTTSDGKTKFPIRANWELGPLLIRF